MTPGKPRRTSDELRAAYGPSWLEVSTTGGKLTYCKTTEHVFVLQFSGFTLGAFNKSYHALMSCWRCSLAYWAPTFRESVPSCGGCGHDFTLEGPTDERAYSVLYCSNPSCRQFGQTFVADTEHEEPREEKGP